MMPPSFTHFLTSFQIYLALFVDSTSDDSDQNNVEKKSYQRFSEAKRMLSFFSFLLRKVRIIWSQSYKMDLVLKSLELTDGTLL